MPEIVTILLSATFGLLFTMVGFSELHDMDPTEREDKAVAILGIAIGLGLLGAQLYGAAFVYTADITTDSMETSGVIEGVDCCGDDGLFVRLDESSDAVGVDELVLTNTDGEYVDSIDIHPGVRTAELNPYGLGPSQYIGDWHITATDDDTVVGAATLSATRVPGLPYIQPPILLGLSALYGLVTGAVAVGVQSWQLQRTQRGEADV